MFSFDDVIMKADEISRNAAAIRMLETGLACMLDANDSMGQGDSEWTFDKIARAQYDLFPWETWYVWFK